MHTAQGVRRPSLLQRARMKKKDKKARKQKKQRGGGKNQEVYREDRLANYGPEDFMDQEYELERQRELDRETELKFHYEPPERKQDPRQTELKEIEKRSRSSTQDVMKARICSRRFDMNMHLVDEGDESDEEDDPYDYYDEEVAELFAPVH